MIRVYTTSTCAYCHALMDWLDENGIEYEEIEAALNLGIRTVPVTEIGEERIVGFDRPAIKRALKKVKTRTNETVTGESDGSKTEKCGWRKPRLRKTKNNAKMDKIIY